MRAVILCATKRGYQFLERFSELAPDIDLTVISFKEEPWEPPFFEDIRNLTNRLGGQFVQGEFLGSEKWTSFWETTPFDIIILVSWRYYVPKSVYQRARIGAYVFHDSLLPEYRGFAPTVWAIINGEDHTGVSIIEMAEEIDAGNILDQQKVPINPDDTINIVMEEVTEAYLYLLEKNIKGLISGELPYTIQDHTKATFTCKRLPLDNLIDWSASAKQIYNLIRAVTFPYTGAYTYLDGKRLRVWGAKRWSNGKKFVGFVPGRVIEIKSGEGSIVLTGDGALLLTQVQFDDGYVVNASGVLTKLSQTLGR